MPNPLSFLARLTLNEWLTLIVGVGSLVVSFMTYRNAIDTRDIKNAVGNLSALTAATANEAGALQNQVGAMKSQADDMGKLIQPAQNSAKAAVASVKQQERNFILDEQPIIALTAPADAHVPLVIGFTPDGELAWNVAYKNFGKTTAKNLRMTSYMSVLGGPFVRSAHATVGTQLVPTDINWATVIYRRSISHESAVYAIDHDLQVAVELDFTFDDNVGNHYCTHICMAHQANGAAHNCNRRNGSPPFS